MSNFFQDLRKSYSSYELERRDLIKISSDILSLSKQAIFALHRDEKKEGEKSIKQAEEGLKQLEKKFQKQPDLQGEGAYRAALEEYVEAKMFYRVLAGLPIGDIKEVGVTTDSYLGGICDLIGEIARQVILLATARDFKKVGRLSTAAHNVMGELIKMDLSGYERTKYDQAKQALRKIEEVAYDISIKN